ncbi:MAG: methyl-accepting chemotaxis protein [Lachnospiraceae bacterium]|nr:methyl-accepting chemotaxis protein [Lachnospiraceae bacterium]
MAKEQKRRKKSFKRQLVASIMALIAIPLVAAIAIASVASVRNTLAAQEELLLERTRVVQEQIEAIIDKNYLVLEALSVNPQIISFLEDPDRTEYDETRAAVIDANNVFGDANPTHLSQPDGDQLIRSDENECKNIATRAYFQKAMTGEKNMSEVLVSLATNSLIDVIIVPVFNEQGEIIGAVQRDYGLSVLAEFTQEAATGNDRVAIIESNGLLMAHSAQSVGSEEERTDYSETAFFADALAKGASGGTLVETLNGQRMLFAFRQDPTTGWIIATTSDYNSMMRQALRGPFFIMIIGFIMLLGAGAIGYYIAQRFSKPILAASAVATAVADGDLQDKPLDVRSKTEIGDMAKAFNDMTGNFRDVISKTRHASNELTAESGQLHASAGKASDAADHVSNAIHEISKGAQSQAQSVQEAAGHAENIGADIDDISGNSEQLDTSSKEMESSCEAAMKALNELIKQSEDVTNSVAEIGETIKSTNSSSQQISEFTDAISSIAAQTNLLSLNASIEAARAGEAGKGFAVVAQEIQKLAEQSSQSADQIKSIVDLLLSNSESSVKVMERLNTDFAQQSEMLEATKQDMVSLEQNAGSVSESAAQITEKIESLNRAKDGLVGIIGDLSAISEENAASAEETNASMQELNDTFLKISAASEKLEQLATGLSDTISYYSE